MNHKIILSILFVLSFIFQANAQKCDNCPPPKIINAGGSSSSGSVDFSNLTPADSNIILGIVNHLDNDPINEIEWEVIENFNSNYDITTYAGVKEFVSIINTGIGIDTIKGVITGDIIFNPNEKVNLTFFDGSWYAKSSTAVEQPREFDITCYEETIDFTAMGAFTSDDTAPFDGGTVTYQDALNDVVDATSIGGSPNQPVFDDDDEFGLSLTFSGTSNDDPVYIVVDQRDLGFTENIRITSAFSSTGAVFASAINGTLQNTGSGQEVIVTDQSQLVIIELNAPDLNAASFYISSSGHFFVMSDYNPVATKYNVVKTIANDGTIDSFAVNLIDNTFVDISGGIPVTWTTCTTEQIDEVIHVTTADVGTAAPIGTKLGIDPATGEEFYVDGSGNWMGVPSVSNTNFANTDLVATGNRYHDFDDQNLELDLINNLFITTGSFNIGTAPNNFTTGPHISSTTSNNTLDLSYRSPITTSETHINIGPSDLNFYSPEGDYHFRRSGTIGATVAIPDAVTSETVENLVVEPSTGKILLREITNKDFIKDVCYEIAASVAKYSVVYFKEGAVIDSLAYDLSDYSLVDISTGIPSNWSICVDSNSGTTLDRQSVFDVTGITATGTVLNYNTGTNPATSNAILNNGSILRFGTQAKIQFDFHFDDDDEIDLDLVNALPVGAKITSVSAMADSGTEEPYADINLNAPNGTNTSIRLNRSNTIDNDVSYYITIWVEGYDNLEEYTVVSADRVEVEDIQRGFTELVSAANYPATYGDILTLNLPSAGTYRVSSGISYNFDNTSTNRARLALDGVLITGTEKNLGDTDTPTGNWRGSTHTEKVITVNAPAVLSLQVEGVVGGGANVVLASNDGNTTLAFEQLPSKTITGDSEAALPVTLEIGTLTGTLDLNTLTNNQYKTATLSAAPTNAPNGTTNFNFDIDVQAIGNWVVQRWTGLDNSNNPNTKTYRRDSFDNGVTWTVW